RQGGHSGLCVARRRRRSGGRAGRAEEASRALWCRPGRGSTTEKHLGLSRDEVMAKPTARVLDILSQSGLLLKQDKCLPNVVTLVTGESLSTSWWSHPKGRLIFAVLSELSDHPDVLFTKLLYRKVTLVHRRLWPALLAVASAGEPWQKRGLLPAARALLTSVTESNTAVRGSGQAVKELEFRLLIHGDQVHTESGHH